MFREGGLKVGTRREDHDIHNKEKSDRNLPL